MVVEVGLIPEVNALSNSKDKRATRRRTRKSSMSVPRGFLVYGSLSYMKENAKSGIELMDEIESNTGWRPSPGSIYPLLKRLRNEGFIQPIESETQGLKQFTLTEQGRQYLDELGKKRDEIRDKYHTIRRLWFKLYGNMSEELYQVTVHLLEVLDQASPKIKENSAMTQNIIDTILDASESILLEINKVEQEVS